MNKILGYSRIHGVQSPRLAVDLAAQKSSRKNVTGISGRGRGHPEKCVALYLHPERVSSRRYSDPEWGRADKNVSGPWRTLGKGGVSLSHTHKPCPWSHTVLRSLLVIHSSATLSDIWYVYAPFYMVRTLDAQHSSLTHIALERTYQNVHTHQLQYSNRWSERYGALTQLLEHYIYFYFRYKPTATFLVVRARST